MKRCDLRWLFFDVGNTLVNEERALNDRVQQMVMAFAERGMCISEGTIERAFEEASAAFAPILMVEVVEKLAAHPEDRAFVLDRVQYRHALEEPYPDAREVLAILSRRYKIGVIANQSAGTAARLERYGLGPFISLCLSSTEIGLRKPDPAIFNLALEQAQCAPHEAVMIGDRLDNDIRPAKSLGWRTIWVLQGFGKMQQPRSPEEEPDFRVRNLGEVLEILRSLDGK